MTWCKLYTHLSWSWCMKKPNSGNSGVRNIVHSASPRCTIFRTPLLPSLGFFIHHSQERCVYTITPLFVTKYTINIMEFCKTPLLNTRNNLLRWLKIFEVLILHRNSGVSWNTTVVYGDTQLYRKEIFEKNIWTYTLKIFQFIDGNQPAKFIDWIE